MNIKLKKKTEQKFINYSRSLIHW